MAERTTQSPILNRAGAVTGYRQVSTTVKKGTSDTKRRKPRGLGDRHLGYSHGPRGQGRGRSLHLMNPWDLKIRDRTKD